MIQKILPYLFAGILFAGVTYGGNNNALSSGSLRKQIVLEDSIIAKYSPNKIRHIDYNKLNFDDYDLMPLDSSFKSRLIEGVLMYEVNSMLIPDSVELGWKKNYFEMDAKKRDYYLQNSRWKYIKNGLSLDSSRLNEFNRGLFYLMSDKSVDPLGSLSVKESCDLVFGITREMLNFVAVDEGSVKIDNIDYNDLAFDDWISTGFGDCNVYGSLANHLFENLKGVNKNLENIYLGHAYYGHINRHDWNQLYFMDGDELRVSSVDLSREDRGFQIRNVGNFYLSECSDENLLNLYYTAADYENWDSWKKLFFASYYGAKKCSIKNPFGVEIFETLNKSSYINFF